MSRYPQTLSNSIERYRFREALSELMNLARLGNKYLADEEPWKQIKTDAARVETIMHIAIQIAGSLAVLSEPFLPFTSSKLKSMLNFQDHGPISWSAIESSKSFLPAGHQINTAELLFEKIENQPIQDQVEKLEASKTQSELKAIEPVKEEIQFDDFAKLDIRVGTIIAAEKVPKTKKLLQLKVDIGLEIRTIVSGIAESYAPEDIIGQKVSVLTNLAPRKLRGVVSQGMILMTETDDGKLSFITSNKHNVNNGERVN